MLNKASSAVNMFIEKSNALFEVLIHWNINGTSDNCFGTALKDLKLNSVKLMLGKPDVAKAILVISYIE